MWKKFLSVATAAGAFAALTYAGGCSSTTVTDTGEAGATDARPDRVVADTGSGEGGGNTCPGDAPTAADLDQAGGWKPPPAVNKTACSANDLKTFESNFTGAQTYSDLVKGLPTGCQTCILSKETDAAWTFIVTDATGQQGFFNYGACYARAAGGSEACGKAVQYDEFCLNVSCSDCSDTEFTSCVKSKATQQACTANFGAAIQSGCSSDQTVLQKLDDACSSATNAVAVLCSTGPADAGGGG